jgi:CRP-like cAMP-binding protein
MGAGLNPQTARVVRNVDIFQGFSPDDVVKIFGHCQTMNVQKDQMLFQKGTVGNQMFVVLGGSFALFDGSRQLATFKPGDTFGEMSLLLHEPRVGMVKAIELSQVLVLDEHLFEKLLTKRVAVQMLLNISRMLARRLKGADQTIREIEGR